MSGENSTIRSFLEEMGVKYKYDEETGIFVAPFTMELNNGRTADLTVLALESDGWIVLVSPLIKEDEMPEGSAEELYRELLCDSLHISGASYGITEDGYIVAYSETPEEGLKLEEFKARFYAVLYSAKEFLEKTG